MFTPAAEPKYQDPLALSLKLSASVIFHDWDGVKIHVLRPECGVLVDGLSVILHSRSLARSPYALAPIAILSAPAYNHLHPDGDPL
jgi:hypothetical protein